MENPGSTLGPCTFEFSGDSHYSVLYIARVPSLVFISQRDGVHLAEILPSGTIGTRNRVEKLKRLFLRHMGFNCARYSNKLRILYPDGTSILIKPTEYYKFKNYSKEYTLIGSHYKPLPKFDTTWKL